MPEEKIYFEEGDVSVTASRVILGDKNFVLRNILAVKVEAHDNLTKAKKKKLLGL